MIKSWMLGSWFIVIALACGVNTGNPPGVAEEPNTSKSTATTLLLDLKALEVGQIALHVDEVHLLPEGESFDSSQAIALTLRDTSAFRSGQKITLASQESLASGSYDRIVLVLQNTDPASLWTDAGEEKAIAIAPYQYYARETGDVSVKRIQLVIALKKRSLRVDAAASQSLEMSTDLTANLQDFSAIAPAALDYYKSINQLDYTYSLDPYTEHAEVNDSVATNASLFVTVDPAYFNIHKLCVYSYEEVAQGASLNDDKLCLRAAYVSALTTSATRGYAAFSIPAAVYVLVARNETGDLLYMQTVTVAEGEQTSMTFPYVPALH